MVIEEKGPVLLLQFAREPRVGGVKTRMLPQLSGEQACELHRELVLWTCQQLLASGLGDVEVSVAGSPQHALFTDCQARGVARISTQRGDDLGQRMAHALKRSLGRYQKVVLVGSDCPAMGPQYLRTAVAALDRVPVVLGPATDGGYVLMGVTAIAQSVFQDIPWGTAAVYATTVAALDRAGQAWEALPPLADIDRPEDLPLWEAIKQASA